MTEDEREYFKMLGIRVARLRKEQGLTQIQMAKALGVSQQTLASYEVGRRRIPVSMLPALAKSLRIQIDVLLDEAANPPAKRGPTPKWQQQIETIAQLPRTQQKFVAQMLDAVIAQAQRG